MNELKEGWVAPFHGTRKYHYYRKNMSLCGKFRIFGFMHEFDKDFDEHPDNCVYCQRKKLKESI